jgi:hypothetical protein
MRSLYFDKQGREITLERWRELFADHDYCSVGATTLPNGEVVSTVWIGIDHGTGEGRPVIFETMVFSSAESEHELAQQRYSTLDEAQKGHETMIEERKVKILLN